MLPNCGTYSTETQRKGRKPVIGGMLDSRSPPLIDASEDDIVVRAPRAADMLSLTLVAAFDRDRELPDAWVPMLARLDQIPLNADRR